MYSIQLYSQFYVEGDRKRERESEKKRGYLFPSHWVIIRLKISSNDDIANEIDWNVDIKKRRSQAESTLYVSGIVLKQQREYECVWDFLFLFKFLLLSLALQTIFIFYMSYTVCWDIQAEL